MATRELMTTEEYLDTPETLIPTELIYGVLRVADSPFAPHQAAAGDFFLALTGHVREHRLGEVLLSPLDVFFDAPIWCSRCCRRTHASAHWLNGSGGSQNTVCASAGCCISSNAGSRC